MSALPFIFGEKLYSKTKKSIAKFYVKITVSIIQFIYFCSERYNSQHSMSAIPENNNILINIYYQKILKTFMLELCVFVTCPLTLVYLEVISNI